MDKAKQDDNLGLDDKPIRARFHITRRTAFKDKLPQAYFRLWAPEAMKPSDIVWEREKSSQSNLKPVEDSAVV